MRRMAAVMAGILIVLIGCSPKEKTIKTDKSTPEGEGTVSFAKDLMPVFERSCGVCHKREGGSKAAVENGTYFEKKEDILGKVGTFIQPGKPAESGLLSVLNQSYPVGGDKIVMPPPNSKAPKWTQEELDLFGRWIEQGAKDN